MRTAPPPVRWLSKYSIPKFRSIVKTQSECSWIWLMRCLSVSDSSNWMAGTLSRELPQSKYEAERRARLSMDSNRAWAQGAPDSRSEFWFGTTLRDQVAESLLTSKSARYSASRLWRQKLPGGG